MQSVVHPLILGSFFLNFDPLIASFSMLMGRIDLRGLPQLDVDAVVRCCDMMPLHHRHYTRLVGLVLLKHRLLMLLLGGPVA